MAVYTPWSVIANEVPTAQKWNILGQNDEGFHDGSAIASNVIDSSKLESDIASLSKVSNSVVTYDASSPARILINSDLRLVGNLYLGDGKVLNRIVESGQNRLTLNVDGAYTLTKIYNDVRLHGKLALNDFVLHLRGETDNNHAIYRSPSYDGKEQNLYLGFQGHSFIVSQDGIPVMSIYNDHIFARNNIKIDGQIQGLNRTIDYLAGEVADGGTIPLPSGYNDADYPQYMAACNSVFSGSHSTSICGVDVSWSGRTVSVAVSRFSVGWVAGGTASFVIICMRARR